MLRVIVTIILLASTALAQGVASGSGGMTGLGGLGITGVSPLVMPSVTPPLGTVSTNYSFLIPVTGGRQPYSCSKTGTLPLATIISVAPTNAGCLVSGTLSAGSGGSYTGIFVTATDSASHAITNPIPGFTITITTPKGCGPPGYLCARTDLAPIQLPVSIPVMGTNSCPLNPLPCYKVGQGTVISDPSFNALTPTIIARVTDGQTLCGARQNFTFNAGVGGSGDVITSDKSVTRVEVEDQGNGHELLAFNPSTYVASGLYVGAYGCAAGGKGTLDVPGGAFSYNLPLIYYGFGTSPSCLASACPSVMDLVQYDVSAPNTGTNGPVITQLFNYQNCLPVGSPAASWRALGEEDVTDRWFAEGASITGGGQGTGGSAMMFDRTNNLCYMYDTIGNFDSARTAIAITGSAATYVKATQAVTITVANPFTVGQQLYMIGITGVMNPLNGYVLTLTAGTSGSQIQGTLTAKLGHADVSGTIGGASCSGTPFAQCANIGTMHPGVYLFTGPSWTQSFVGYVNPAIGNFTIHNVKIAKDGSFLVVAHQVCLTTCASNLPQQLWMTGTNTVNTDNGNYGHWSPGDKMLVGEGASSQPYWTWNIVKFATPPTSNPKCAPTSGTDICLLAPMPNGGSVCAKPYSNPPIQPCIINMDGHPSWNTNNPAFRSTWSIPEDQTPVLTSSYSVQWNQGQSMFGPWINEVHGINTCNTGGLGSASCNVNGNPSWRFGHTFNTALSSKFSTLNEIGAASSDGRFYFFSSDWQGTLGQNAGTTTGCTGGTDLASCRGDVFVMVLQ